MILKNICKKDYIITQNFYQLNIVYMKSVNSHSLIKIEVFITKFSYPDTDNSSKITSSKK